MKIQENWVIHCWWEYEMSEKKLIANDYIPYDSIYNI